MLKSNFTTEKGNMQYPAGSARGQFVRKVVSIRYAIGYRSVSAGSARRQFVRCVVNISHP